MTSKKESLQPVTPYRVFFFKLVEYFQRRGNGDLGRHPGVWSFQRRDSGLADLPTAPGSLWAANHEQAKAELQTVQLYFYIVV